MLISGITDTSLTIESVSLACEILWRDLEATAKNVRIIEEDASFTDDMCYPAEKPKPKPRCPLEAVLHKD